MKFIKTTAMVVCLLSIGCEQKAVPKPKTMSVNSKKVAETESLEPTFLNVDPPTNGNSMAPNLYLDGEAFGATWLEATETGHRLQHATLSKGKWSKPTTISEGDDFVANWADVPTATRGGDNALYASWLKKIEGGPYAYGVQLARDSGDSWKPLGTPHDDSATEHGFVSMIPHQDGVEMVWLDGRQMVAKLPGPMNLRSAVIGEKIGKSQIVDDRVCDCCGTSMAKTKKDVVLAYRDRSDEEVRDITVVKKSLSSWSARSLKKDRWTIQGCPVNGPALATTGDQVAVAWFTGADQTSRVRVAISSGDDMFLDPMTVSEGDTIGRVDVVWLADDHAFVTYVDQRENAIIRGRSIIDGRLGRAFDLATTSSARASGFPKVEVVAGQLLMLWTEADEEKKTSIRAQLISLPDSKIAAPKTPDGTKKVKTGPQTGWEMPRYIVDDLNGEKLNLTAEKGAVFINFWATWCKPCRKEMPALDAFFKEHSTIKMLAVSIDEPSATKQLRTESKKFEFKILHDAQNLAAGIFGVSALPHSFLFVDGKLVWSHAGELTDLNDLSLEVKKFRRNGTTK